MLVLNRLNNPQNIHCVKSVLSPRFSGPYFPAFGLNTDTFHVATIRTKHLCPNLFDTRLSLILSCIMWKKKIKCTLKVLRCSKVNIGFLSIENPDEILQRNEIIYLNLVNYSEIRNIFCSRHISS